MLINNFNAIKLPQHQKKQQPKPLPSTPNYYLQTDLVSFGNKALPPIKTEAAQTTAKTSDNNSLINMIPRNFIDSPDFTDFIQATGDKYPPLIPFLSALEAQANPQLSPQEQELLSRINNLAAINLSKQDLRAMVKVAKEHYTNNSYPPKNYTSQEVVEKKLDRDWPIPLIAALTAQKAKDSGNFAQAERLYTAAFNIHEVNKYSHLEPEGYFNGMKELQAIYTAHPDIKFEHKTINTARTEQFTNTVLSHYALDSTDLDLPFKLDLIDQMTQVMFDRHNNRENQKDPDAYKYIWEDLSKAYYPTFHADVNEGLYYASEKTDIITAGLEQLSQKYDQQGNLALAELSLSKRADLLTDQCRFDDSLSRQ